VLRTLYCIDLANFGRGFYTIEGRRPIYLDVVAHARYDDGFPNKGKEAERGANAGPEVNAPVGNGCSTLPILAVAGDPRVSPFRTRTI